MKDFRLSRRLALSMGVLVLLNVLTLLVLADTRSYTPPPEKGDIYVVIRYKTAGSMGGMYPQDTRVSINWGGYRRSEVIKPPKILPGRAIAAKGFVLKLRHTKNDSITMTVDTDGQIINGPYQGAPPREWNDRDFDRKPW